MSFNLNGDPAGCYDHARATAYLIAPAGTYTLAGETGSKVSRSPPAGMHIPVIGATAPAAEIADPAGKYSGAGATAPTLVAGAHIPLIGETSATEEVVDPAGAHTLTLARVSARTDRGGTQIGRRAATPTLGAASPQFPLIRETPAAGEAVDPAGAYGPAGASARTDPGGTNIGRRATPTVAAAGANVPVIGPTAAASGPAGASAPETGRTGAVAALAASAPAINPNGAPPGYYYEPGATAYIEDPAGTYSLAGARAPTPDPAGTYSAAGASAPTEDPAGAYSSPYALNRLLLDALPDTPVFDVLAFKSVTAVANYYGATSGEATLAADFFAGYSDTGATMVFAHFPEGPVRAHLYGANISNLTLAQLKAINGSLTLSVDGYSYSGSVNLSGAASFLAAATAIETALNQSLPPAAVTKGSSITPESTTFTGSINAYVLTVTSVQSGSIQVGSIVSGVRVPAGTQITAQLSGTPNGDGTYSLFLNSGQTSSSETLTATYGVLTVGSVVSGTVASGQQVTDTTGNVLPLTAIWGNLSGSGAGSTWVVDLAQTVSGEAMTTAGPSVSVGYDGIAGATANRDFFSIQQNGTFPLAPSTLSYAGGTIAGSLGLTQASGALSSPGEAAQLGSASEWLDNFVQTESDQFGSFQTIWDPIEARPPGEQSALAAWAAETGGRYNYLDTWSAKTPPAGASAPTVDPAGTYSGPGASFPAPAAAGTYIPVTGATSAAAEIVDAAGTYSVAGASAPTTDPAGTYSAAGASAPTQDPAGTYSSPYALDRLIVDLTNNLPVDRMVPFSSATAVANFFGAASEEAALASEFFAGYAGTSAKMLFTRYPFTGVRSHLFSANLSSLSLSQLQSVSGSLSVTVNSNIYSGSVNLFNVQSFSAAATAIQNALNSNLAVLATTTGDSIRPESVSFTGTINALYLEVTSAPAGSIHLGSIISGPGVPAGTEIVTQLNGTPGGVGLYNLWVSGGVVSSETMTESYGVLTVGSVASGSVAPGEQLSGSGIASNTAILSNLSGSGAGSTWIVNNAQTVVGASANVLAPSLKVVNNPVTGATANRDYFDVGEAGAYDYDYLPSTISYAGGTAAAALGLTQASGSLLSNPGGPPEAADRYMNNLVQNVDDQFGSFQLPQVPVLVAQYDPAYLGDFVNWAQSTHGQHTDLGQYGYITTTPPAGTSMPTTDPAGTYSGPGANLPMPAAPGRYIPVTGATSAAAEIVDSPGSYSLVGASAPTLAQPGYYVPTAGASRETRDDPGYYTPYAGATAEIKALPPIISGTVAGQSTRSGQPDTPFSSATIADPNIDTKDSVSINVTGGGGTLADGAGFNGLMKSASGVYTLSGTAAAITRELAALVFTPNTLSATTTFTLVDTTSVGTSAHNANTTVKVTHGGQVVASVSKFLADKSTLDGTPGGFDILDGAASITANLDQLNDPHIDAIVISNNRHVVSSVQQLTTDARAIGDLQNANDSHVRLAIHDTAADVQAGLSTLAADNGEIGSITASNGPIVVSAATFLADQSALDKIVGGFDVSDTAANLVADLDQLDADSHVAGITAITGHATLGGGVGVNAPNFSESGGGTSLTLSEALAYAGAFSQGSGSTIAISSGDRLSLTGTASLSGTTSGAGTLALAGGGSATIKSGAIISVSHWSIFGAGTDLTLDESLNYAGSFSEAEGDTFVLSGGHLLLSGAATFAGGTVDGSKFLYAEGTTTVSGLTIGGTVEWENTNVVNERGGSATIGGASGDEAILYNTPKATYNIADNSGIARGSSTASHIDNAGLFEKAGGTGTSLIAPAVANSGTIEVTSGTLDFKGAISGTGTDTILGASTLEFDAKVAVGQTVQFTGVRGELALHAPAAFAGQISGFDTVGANDTIEVARPWVFSGFTENAGGAQGTLTFANGASTLSLTLLGDYIPADFVHQTQANGSTLITYTHNGGLDSLRPPVSGAETHAGGFDIRREATGSGRGDWGAGAGWDGAIGHAPGPSA
jgi:Protein of unknown function (DUF3383)